MRQFKGIVLGLLICQGAFAQSVVQRPMTYNADVIREVGGTISSGIERSWVDEGNQSFLRFNRRAFVTQSEAALHDPTDAHGLPDDGVFTVPGGVIRLGPYDGNNGLILTDDNRTGPSIGGLAGNPNRPDFWRIYAVGTAKFPTITGLLAHFERAGPNGRGTLARDLWDEDPPGAVYLIDGMDRTSDVGDGFEDVDDVAIFQYDIDLRDSALESVSLSYSREVATSPESAVIILAQALVYVPEPSGAAGMLLLIGLVLRRRRRCDV
jgi:hypothetical protein